MSSKFCFSMLSLTLLLGTLSGCNSDKGNQSNSEDSEKTLKIAVIPKGTTHEFWKSVHYGAEQAAKELGNVEIIWKGPQEEDDREEQIKVVQNFITKNVDGICLAPLDAQALQDYVIEAKESDIPVVIFDSGLEGDEDNYVNYVATRNEKGGELAADEMGKLLEGKGNVILFRYNQGSESTEQREEAFLKRLKEKYPDITILSTEELGTTPEGSASKAYQVLSIYKDQVDGVFAVCEPNATGTLDALEQLEIAGQVKFIAFDPNATLIKGMEDGKVHGIVLQDPVKMGYEAVMSMVKHIRGEEVPKRIGTGEYIATPDNMGTPEMQKLLKPAQYKE